MTEPALELIDELKLEPIKPLAPERRGELAFFVVLGACLLALMLYASGAIDRRELRRIGAKVDTIDQRIHAEEKKIDRTLEIAEKFAKGDER